MFKEIKKKPFAFGTLLLGVNIFILYVKFSNPLNNMVPNRGDLMDGFFGFILLGIFFILCLSIISYSLSIKSKFSDMGEIIFNFLGTLYSKK